MKPKIIVFDTNTLISAMIFPSSVPSQAFQKGLLQGEVVYSEETLNEIKVVAKRSKFDKYSTSEKRQLVIDEYEQAAILIEKISTQIVACRDPKDDKFLTLAVTAKADYIVSGDEDLLVLHPFQGIQIIKPAVFLEIILS
jgi:uncharacterized protein